MKSCDRVVYGKIMGRRVLEKNVDNFLSQM